MNATDVEKVGQLARLGEAVLAAVRESGLLRRKPGRKAAGRKPAKKSTTTAEE